ncbi:hypothetical protein SAMD00019534_009600 [Acytostelium subglobosum LB1]|uniref:hypothetical protein n=1 Tax=Acytostelium subglobosum LB1 TaxID=1410327 RepID=UPI000644DABB|nr:hypothetical protein SAMD00019534_009600 [Acytostelium subglobosum LB1]GAM17785.1 hypothetical protein SAMD00019534_009600 [Acytostelium subglobosum LB1]|eukprot:XP_012758381.1 hypothetical protein SAMD00019534_009600 [Acytostelium subglobosum LB1]
MQSLCRTKYLYHADVLRRSSKIVSSNIVSNNNRAYCSVSNNVVSTPTRGKDRQSCKLVEGDRLHGYKVVKIEDVPERQFRTYRLLHEKTGAQHLHIDCEDKNNVFSVTFKTTPHDSTGVAHILEHTTLCGSKRYPVRDPFFNMLKRSLNTYMNAWTAPDHTSYPFGTQDPKDYYNLLSVYLDATFFPLLSESDFRQEGHRLEFEVLDQPSSALKFKGIVFNEMKGALSDPSSFFSEVAQQNLYPSTTYAHNSGGEPVDIPSLTYEQLKDFHTTYYHPSNAYFFTYGDMPLEKHLEYIQQNSLAHFTEMKSIPSEVNKVPRWSEPKSIDVKCLPSAMEVNDRKYKYSISILHKDNGDPFESLSMHVLANLLIRGSNSPMYQALLVSGLATDYTPNTGFDDNFRESSFSVGASGVRQEDMAKVEKTIFETIEKSIKEGFEPKMIESILHQYEFGQKDVSAQLGLRLAGGLQSTWIHGGDPVRRLFLNEQVARLRKEIAAGPFFQNRLQQLLNNPHRLVIKMSPDEEMQARETAQEEKKLAEIKSALTQQDVEKIVQQAKDLQQRQNQQQDVSCLPKLNISDIEKHQEKIVFRDTELGADSTPLRILDYPTNGITYFRSLIDISTLPEDLKMYVPLFCSLFESMGAAEFDYKQLDTEIHLYTGKLSLSPMITTSPFDLGKASERIYMRGAAINRNIEKMFTLLSKLMLENKWNNPDLLKNLLGQIQSSMIEGIPSGGLSYARTNSSSHFSRANQLSEKWNGLTHVNFTNDIIAKNDLGAIIDKLMAINKFILDRSLMKCSITTEKDTIDAATQHLSAYLGNFSSNGTRTQVNPMAPAIDGTGLPTYFAIPATVNYISKAYNGVNYVDPDSAPLEVLSKVLSEYLHKEIREKGGAYGGGASFGGGIIGFYSYRDPNLTKTLNAFAESIKWSQDKITQELIENAQLSIFSDFDSPESPSNKGVGEWMRGITHQMKQERRDRLLGITKEQLEQVSNRYLNTDRISYTTVLGKHDTDISSNKDWSYKELH